MVIWITGASSGLGREVALQYAAAGHSVCVSARSADALNALAESTSGKSGSVEPYPLDVTDSVEVKKVFDKIFERHGIPDLSILNAGTHAPNSARHFDSEVFRRIMDINYNGTINCLQALIPACMSAGRGQIGVVSSVAGYRGLAGASAYGASKAALINLCEALHPELAAAGVRLSLVNPGFVRTPLTDKNDFPMPFLMEVDVAARQMIQGLASGRFEVTFPKRFTWMLKFLRILPIGLYLRLTRNLIDRG